MLHYKEDYGTDIDGNRGITITSHEIDSDDTYALLQDALDVYKEWDEIPEEYEVDLICPICEECLTFDVRKGDYFTEKEFNQFKKEQ